MKLSDRSVELVSRPTGIVKGHVKCLENPFSEKNPNGYLNFGTAENDLMSEVICKKLSEDSSISSELIHYGDISGLQILKKAFTQFAAKYFQIRLNPEHIVIQNGISSLCESLCYCLLNPNEKIFCFAPYYSGFDFDFSRRFNGNLIPIDLSPKDGYYHHVESLDEAYAIHPDVRALLICHPHNPTGRILSADEIKNIISWCKAQNIHLIVDEIYALSLINPLKEFKSFLHPDFERYENLHYLYGMAKDFGLGGFKVGFFHTQNLELLKRMQAVSYFHCVSSYTQLAVARLLSDSIFLKAYISQNQKLLKAAFLELAAAFPDFQAPEAGLYCYTKISDNELIDYEILLDKFRINIQPGKYFHDPNPGYFRICFAKGDRALKEFILRFKRFSDT